MPFSIDLRTRVMNAIDAGMKPKTIVKTFQICRRTIYNWIALRGRTGNIEPKVNYQKGHSHKITDWDKFKDFVESNKGCTVLKFISKWKDLTDVDVSESVMERALKKINYTSKKKHSTMLKQMKQKE